jgi:hypothetical protein
MTPSMVLVTSATGLSGGTLARQLASHNCPGSGVRETKVAIEDGLYQSCRVSPARNSSQTSRLNATLWDRCCPWAFF